MSRYRRPFSLYKRGKYYYFKTYRPDGSRTCGTSTGCTSKGAAEKFCNNLFLQGNLTSTDISFFRYASHFFDDDGIYFSDKVNNKALGTRKQYRYYLNKHLIPYFKNKKLADITYSVIKNYRNILVDKYSINTVKLILNNLRIILNTAYRDGLININPFEFLEDMQGGNTIRDAFTLEEVKTLYNSIREEFKRPVLCMALCGMRISEYIGTSKDNLINTNDIYYYDLKTQLYENNRVSVKDNSIREIPLIPEIIDLLEFPAKKKGSFYLDFKKICETFPNSKERKLSFHSLRHFFCTNAKASGIPEIKVEYLMGHKTKDIKGIYTNFKALDCLEILSWQKKMLKEITE